MVSAVAPTKKVAGKKPSKRKAVAGKQTRDTSPYPDFIHGSAVGGSKRKATSPPPDFISTHR